MPLKPDYLSYDDIREIAQEFMEKYHPEQKHPIPVEYIADVILGIDIVPVSDWFDQGNDDIFSLLSSDRQTIFVDETVYDHVITRYRFTIAHELGHWYMHENLLNKANFDHVDGWKEFLRAMTDEDYGWFEFQANSFAGLILVPEDLLNQALTTAKRKLDFNPDFSQEADCEVVAQKIAPHFHVSKNVIIKRGNHDGHWEYR